MVVAAVAVMVASVVEREVKEVVSPAHSGRHACQKIVGVRCPEKAPEDR